MLPIGGYRYSLPHSGQHTALRGHLHGDPNATQTPGHKPCDFTAYTPSSPLGPSAIQPCKNHHRGKERTTLFSLFFIDKTAFSRLASPQLQRHYFDTESDNDSSKAEGQRSWIFNKSHGSTRPKPSKFFRVDARARVALTFVATSINSMITLSPLFCTGFSSRRAPRAAAPSAHDDERTLGSTTSQRHCALT